MVRTGRDGRRGPCTERVFFRNVDKENRSRKLLQYKILGFEMLKILHPKGYLCVLTKYTAEPGIK